MILCQQGSLCQLQLGRGHACQQVYQQREIGLVTYAWYSAQCYFEELNSLLKFRGGTQMGRWVSESAQLTSCTNAAMKALYKCILCRTGAAILHNPSGVGSRVGQ